MPKNSPGAKRLRKALQSNLQPKVRTTRGVITSVQKDAAGRATGAIASIGGLSNQKVRIDHGANYQVGDVLEVVNDGGSASPSWYARRRVTTNIPVPTIQINPTLPVPTGLDASHTENGIYAQLLISWETADPLYGEMTYDIHVRANDPELYDNTFNVRDDKIESVLQADITSSGDAIPHDIDTDEDLPDAGRVLIDAELIDYTVATSGDGDTGTGTGSTNTLTDGSKSWTVDEWINWALIDSAGTVFKITDSAATTLTVSGTPTSGSYAICPALTGLTRAAGSTTAAAHSDTAPIYVRTEYLRIVFLPCDTYNIRARSHRVIDDTVSAWTSTITEVATDEVPPSAPDDFVATSAYGGIHFSWDPPNDEDLAGFNIYKATSTSGTGATLYKTVVSTASSLQVAEDAGFTGFFNIKAYDRSGNESAYSLTTWDYAISAIRGTGQMLTNADWEVGDVSTDDIQDWEYFEYLSYGTPTFDYQATGGIFNSKSVYAATTAPAQQGYVSLIWPDPITAIKVPGVPNAAYAISVYIKQTGSEEVVPLISLGSHDGSINTTFVGESTSMLWSVKELADGWQRYTNVRVWDGTYDYVAVKIQADATYITGPATLVMDRPMLEIGLASSEWSLYSAPVGDSSGVLGLRLDTTAIVGDNLVIDKDGLVASNIEFAANNTYDIGTATVKPKDIYVAGDLDVGDQVTADRMQVGSPSTGPGADDLAVAGDLRYEGDLTVRRSGDDYTGQVILARGYGIPSSSPTMTTSAQDVITFSNVTVPAGATVRIRATATFTCSSYTGAQVVHAQALLTNGTHWRNATCSVHHVDQWMSVTVIFNHTYASEVTTDIKLRAYKGVTTCTIALQAGFTEMEYDIIG